MQSAKISIKSFATGSALVVGLVGAVPSVMAEPIYDKSTGRITGKIEYTRVSPPTAGVKLLNLILDRVRSTPAFALLNKEQNKRADAANLPALGISSYQLAIKPKESPRSGFSAIAQLVPTPTTSSLSRSGLAPRSSGLVPPPPLGSSARIAKLSVASGSMDGGSLSVASGSISAGSGGSAVIASSAGGTMSLNSSNASGTYYAGRSKLQIVNDASTQAMHESKEFDMMDSKSESRIESKGKRREQIALLPPNVATGIPKVKLGITQAEAGQSLKTWGSMREDVIGSWTVWSFQKPNSTEPLLQVYMRHGLVEALRIFEPELVGSDLGVRLGDGVKVLKENFGEPAFILPEPMPGAGQNYVYPLSQVAFLLSRDNPKAEPEVVSLLIFDVK